MDLRLLVHHADADWPEHSVLTDEALSELYAPMRHNWLRVNMVCTLDGSATDANGLTASLGNDMDKRLFHLLRRMSDAIVVGAATARTEDYGLDDRPIVLLSNSGEMPPRLLDATPGSILMVTCERSPNIVSMAQRLGAENLLLLGDNEVDLTRLAPALAARGWFNLLCEGGPRLFSALLQENLVDELCLTQVPLLMGGQYPRVVSTEPLSSSLELHLLLEAGGTLFGRWLIGKRMSKVQANLEADRPHEGDRFREEV